MDDAGDNVNDDDAKIDCLDGFHEPSSDFALGSTLTRIEGVMDEALETEGVVQEEDEEEDEEEVTTLSARKESEESVEDDRCCCNRCCC